VKVRLPRTPKCFEVASPPSCSRRGPFFTERDSDGSRWSPAVGPLAARFSFQDEEAGLFFSCASPPLESFFSALASSVFVMQNWNFFSVRRLNPLSRRSNLCFSLSGEALNLQHFPRSRSGFFFSIEVVLELIFRVGARVSALINRVGLL